VKARVLRISTVNEIVEEAIMQHKRGKDKPAYDFFKQTMTGSLMFNYDSQNTVLPGHNPGFWRHYDEWLPDMDQRGIRLSRDSYEKFVNARSEINSKDEESMFCEAAMTIRGGMDMPMPWSLLLRGDKEDKWISYRSLLCDLNGVDKKHTRYPAFNLLPDSCGFHIGVDTVRPLEWLAVATSPEPTAFPIALTTRGDRFGISAVQPTRGLETVIPQAFAYRTY
jgi:hypothetical protein